MTYFVIFVSGGPHAGSRDVLHLPDFFLLILALNKSFACLNFLFTSLLIYYVTYLLLPE